METKKCGHCGRELPLDNFYKNKATKDGYFSVCKDCHDEAVAKYKDKRKKEKAEEMKKEEPVQTPVVKEEVKRVGAYGKTIDEQKTNQINVTWQASPASLSDFAPRDIIKHLYNLGYRIEDNKLVCYVKQVVKLGDIINA